MSSEPPLNFNSGRGIPHFAVNLDMAKRAQIMLSSQLLSLATIVRDE